MDAICNYKTGVCFCKNKFFKGDRCDQCHVKYYWVNDNLGCQPCGCPEDNVRTTGACYPGLYGTPSLAPTSSSHFSDGNDSVRCHCLSPYTGIKCDLCERGHFRDSKGLCHKCQCNGNENAAAKVACDSKGVCLIITNPIWTTLSQQDAVWIAPTTRLATNARFALRDSQEVPFSETALQFTLTKTRTSWSMTPGQTWISQWASACPSWCSPSSSFAQSSCASRWGIARSRWNCGRFPWTMRASISLPKWRMDTWPRNSSKTTSDRTLTFLTPSHEASAVCFLWQ